MFKPIDSKYDFKSKYTYLNLESCKASNISQTSRSKSKLGNISSNRIYDIKELNRGRDAHNFRENLKRSISNTRSPLGLSTTDPSGVMTTNKGSVQRAMSENQLLLGKNEKSNQTSNKPLNNNLISKKNNDIQLDRQSKNNK